MNTISFTYQWYEFLINELKHEGFRFKGYSEELDREDILLRHDVDWSPRKANTLAEIESKNDVSSTYFFFLTSPFYNSFDKQNQKIIEKISGMGHSIGLHFSTHTYSDKEMSKEKVESLVNKEKSILSAITGEDIDTVSFHNPPEWVLKRQFDSFINTYEERFFGQIEYRADSNQRWRERHPFEDDVQGPLQLLVHPVLWGERDAWASDRLREERDFLMKKIDEFLTVTDRTWPGPFGIKSSED